MAKKMFEETLLAENYHLKINEVPTEDVNPEFVPDTYRAIVQGLAAAAKDVRDKESPASVVVNDIKGNPIFGVKIEFIPGADEESGSWNTIWSFNPDDITGEGIKVYDVASATIEPYFIRTLAKFKFRVYQNTGVCYTLVRTAFDVLRTYLDQNALEAEPFEVELEGFFTANVNVVDGIKIFNFIPDEEVTNIAKSDGDIVTM